MILISAAVEKETTGRTSKTHNVVKFSLSQLTHKHTQNKETYDAGLRMKQNQRELLKSITLDAQNFITTSKGI